MFSTYLYLELPLTAVSSGCDATQGSSEPFPWGRTSAIWREASLDEARLLPGTAAYNSALPAVVTEAVCQRFLLFHFWTGQHTLASRKLDKAMGLVLVHEL